MTATPDKLLPDRVFWFGEVSATAPDVPAWHRAMTARMLANPEASSDVLLLLTDAFTEAANFAANEGNGHLAIQLHKLADVPRRLAPLRAQGAG